MKTTVIGTDDPGQRRVSQTAPSSEAKFDACLSTTPNRHITYTTAQLHETLNNIFFQGYRIGLDPLIRHCMVIQCDMSTLFTTPEGRYSVDCSNMKYTFSMFVDIN